MSLNRLERSQKPVGAGGVSSESPRYPFRQGGQAAPQGFSLRRSFGRRGLRARPGESGRRDAERQQKGQADRRTGEQQVGLEVFSS